MRTPIALAILLCAAPAAAEPMVAYMKDPTLVELPRVVMMRCKPRDEVVAMLTKRFGESPKMHGLIGKPGSPLRVLEVWSAKSTWTITETYAVGDTMRMCIRLSGYGAWLVPQGLRL